MKAVPVVTLLINSLLTSTHGFTVNHAGVKNNLIHLQMSSTTTAEAENPRLEGLALALDSGTRKSHSVAQNTAFVTGFFKGLSTKESYGALLTSLYYVYTEMENAFEQTDAEVVRKLDSKELRRVDSLKVDLNYFYGDDWNNKLKPTRATQTYVDRVKEVAENKPYLLVAHQYTRYLGDLFGGQMMGGMATRSLSLDAGQGIAFYTFDDIPKANEFITEWYALLNSLDLTEEQKEEIVDEANLVFDLNIGILEDLEGSAVGAFWALLKNTFKEKMGM